MLQIVVCERSMRIWLSQARLKTKCSIRQWRAGAIQPQAAVSAQQPAVAHTWAQQSGQHFSYPNTVQIPKFKLCHMI